MLYAELCCVRTWLIAAVIYAATLLPLCGSQTSVGEIPFQFRDGLIWFQLETPWATTRLNFLLDLGSETSVFNLKTAERLGLHFKHRTKVQGVNSTAIGYWTEPVSARAGDIDMPTEYLAVDLGELSGACACRVDGLLGADFFTKRVAEIDFAQSKIRLLAEHLPQPTETSVPLQLKRGALRIQIQINGGATEWVRLDTGCASSLEWVCPPQHVAGRGNLEIGLTEAPGARMRARVQLGRAMLEDVATGLRSKPIFPGEAGLLGNGVLSRFAMVTIDCRHHLLCLRESASVDGINVASKGNP